MDRDKFKSDQEEYIFRFSEALLGRMGTFIPNKYRGSHEPSDLAWIHGNCAVLFYQHRYVDSLTRMIHHNFKQLYRWMSDWRAGQPLCGQVGNIENRYGYEDIDIIIAISVVGGERSASISGVHKKFEDIFDLYNEKKIVAATISETLYSYFSNNIISIVDLIDLLYFLETRGKAVADSEVIEHFEGRIHAFADLAFSDFHGSSANYKSAFQSWIEAKKLIQHIKLRKDVEPGILAWAELTIEDLIRLTVAESSMIPRIAAPGKFGHLQLYAPMRSGPYEIASVVCSSFSELLKFEEAGHTKAFDFYMVACLEFGHDQPHRSMVIAKEAFDGRRLARGVRELRQTVARV